MMDEVWSSPAVVPIALTHREALHEHLLLALKAHVARPFDEAPEVAAGGLQAAKKKGCNRTDRSTRGERGQTGVASTSQAGKQTHFVS